MSRTANSSKQRSEASRASSAATGAIGSSPATSPLLRACRHRCRRACTSAMKAWKCARRFDRASTASKKRVHQHRLAAPDRAVDVETARRLGRLQPDQPGEGAGLRVGRCSPGASGTARRACRREPPGPDRIRNGGRGRARGSARGWRSSSAVIARGPLPQRAEAVPGSQAMAALGRAQDSRSGWRRDEGAPQEPGCLNAPLPSSAPRARRPAAGTCSLSAGLRAPRPSLAPPPAASPRSRRPAPRTRVRRAPAAACGR